MSTESLARGILDAYSTPGWHYGCPAPVYHTVEAASAHRLHDLSRSAAHCRHNIDHPFDASLAMIVGSATDAMTLEGDVAFDSAFVVSEQCAAYSKEGNRCRNDGKFHVAGEWKCGIHAKADRFKATWDAIAVKLESEGAVLDHASQSGSRYYLRTTGQIVRVSDHAPTAYCERRLIRDGSDSIRVDLPPYGSDDKRQVISPADFERVVNMQDAVLSDREASKYISQGKGIRQASGIFIDDETGQLVKFRPDYIREDMACMLDLKTTDDARPENWVHKATRLGNMRQPPIYLHGSAKLGKSIDTFGFLLVESEQPHGVKLLWVPDKIIAEEWRDVQGLLHKYRACDVAGNWPGYETVGEIEMTYRRAKELGLRGGF